MSIKYVQSPTLYLAGSGVIVGATSITLTNLTDIYGNVLTMTDFGSIGYITLEPDTTNAEAASFTGVSANSNGTYTLTGVKTVLAVSPYTQTSGLVRSHAGGTKVVVTDNVAFWNTFPNKANAETITGKYTFPGDNTNRPTNGTDVDTTTVTDLVTYGQLQRTSIAGATVSSTTVTGIIKVSVDPASPTSPIAVGDNDGRVPTQGENDALAGTSGTPSSSNKYVTNDDTSVTATANKVVRADANNKIDPDYVKVTDIQSFTTAGTTSWTKPTGAKFVEVHVFGAGGGGAGASAPWGSQGGGGGGGYGFKSFVASALGATENLTVGAGGTAGSAGTSGVAGGFSSFGTTVYLKAQGGGGGAYNSGGTGSGGSGGTANGDRWQTGGNGGNGGVQGTDTTSDISPRGGGGSGFAGGGFITNFVLSGGATGNPPTAGTTGSTTLIYGGTGGGGSNNVASAGAVGGAIGAGGGAGTGNGSTSSAGGDGGDGAVIVITYF